VVIAIVVAAVRVVPVVPAVVDRVVPVDVVGVPVVRAADVALVAKVSRQVPVVVAAENSAAAIAIVVRVATVVVLVAHVRKDRTHPGRMQVASSVRRSSLGSALMVSRCRRAASARASRSVPTQTAWDPTESRGIPSVARSVRPSAKRT
jgi:hypothetical protein